MRGFFYLLIANITTNPGKASNAKTTTATEIISATVSHLVLCGITPQISYRFYPKSYQLRQDLSNRTLAQQLR